ncbi:MAG: hypothetical protein L0322_11470, partial [Chloroflexi bacterium]|nr:hypothetical protein [Chloroflexota bacterium]
AVTNSTLSTNSAQSVGGGVYNQAGSLTVTNSTLRDNLAEDGSGIYNSGTLVLTSSTLRGNAAELNGGGLNNVIGSSLVVNSTFSGNSASYGGGIYNGGSLALTNSTLRANSVVYEGGSIYSEIDIAQTQVQSTIIASSAGSDNCAGEANLSLGYNIASDGTCNLTGPGDQPNTAPLLGALANNGGPTWTHLPAEGSPAIDLGHPTGCPATDQRGVLRPQDGDGDGTAVCDVGAVEVVIWTLYLPLVRR